MNESVRLTCVKMAESPQNTMYLKTDVFMRCLAKKLMEFRNLVNKNCDVIHARSTPKPLDTADC